MSKRTSQPVYFQDADKAREHLEGLCWPNGKPVCPHCGVEGDHYQIKGKTTRPGLWKCKDCRKQFSVTVGTVFERSKIPLNLWLQAVYLMCASKKGISSHQIHRMLGVTYKTAWFMTHRIREAMRVMGFEKLGSGGGIVEADETYWGTAKDAEASRKRRGKKRRAGHHKMKIFALVERDGTARSFHVPDVNASNLKARLLSNVSRDAHLMTDEAQFYKVTGRKFASHETVNHSKYEYARGLVSTNTVEGYFSILKRGLVGTFHHVSEHHLQRYCYEFDFRYSNRKITDIERSDEALKGITGKRLTYRRVDYGTDIPAP
jgi:transposase-like protein